jgi:hypothetical protein
MAPRILAPAVARNRAPRSNGTDRPLRGLIDYWGRRCNDWKARKHSGNGRAPSPNGASDLDRAASTGRPRPADQAASERQGRGGRRAASQKAQVGACLGSEAGRCAAGERARVPSAQSASASKAVSRRGGSPAASAGCLNFRNERSSRRLLRSGGSTRGFNRSRGSAELG